MNYHALFVFVFKKQQNFILLQILGGALWDIMFLNTLLTPSQN